MSYKSKVLAAADGGTGVANSSTITLAGNLVTSGANSLTLTTTGSTNVTLPTSGTLATTSQLPSGFAPNKTIQVYDDFLGFYQSGSFAWGQLPWTVITNTWAIDTSDQSLNPGTIENPSLSSGSINLHLACPSNTAAQSIVLGCGAISINWVFKINTLSTGTNTYSFALGLSDTQGLPSLSANALGFQYNSTVNSGNWQCITATANTRDTVNSSTAAATGWHNANISINAAGTSSTFTLDGVLLETITSDLPLTGVSPFVYLTRTAGTVAAGSVAIDLMYMTITLTTAR